MSAWGTVTWDIARAGGFTAYVLLALSVALGLALTLHWHSLRWPRLLNTELHNFLSLLALVFTVVHVAAVWLDPFTRFGWKEIFLPLASHYRPLWMALGIVALYLGLAIGLSTLLRPLIGYAWWRRLHVLTLGIFALVTVHGIATGSDTRTPWGLGIYLGAIVLVGSLLCVRLLVPATPRERAHPGVALACALLLLLGAGWVAAGPLEPGWNAAANNGNGSGARVALAASGTSGTGAGTSGTGAGTGGAATGTGTITGAFSDSAQGTLTQQGPDLSGAVTLRLRLGLSGAVAGTAVIVLQGQASNNGDVAISTTSVTLTPTGGSASYTGALTSLRAGDTWRMGAVLTNASAQAIQVRLDLSIDGSGAVSGTLTGAPTSAPSTGASSTGASGE